MTVFHGPGCPQGLAHLQQLSTAMLSLEPDHKLVCFSPILFLSVPK